MKALLTQEEAAARAGLGYKRWQDIERGAHGPRLSSIVKIANALGLDVWELMSKR